MKATIVQRLSASPFPLGMAAGAKLNVTAIEHRLCDARPSPQTSTLDLPTCLSALIIPSVPPLLFLAIILLRFARRLCSRCVGGRAPPRSESGPPLKQRRDRSLWLGALACSGLLAVGAVASLLIGLLVRSAQLPLAWLFAPAVEAFAATACALSIGLSRAASTRLRERAFVGGYAIFQTTATIGVTLALLPPGAANAWLISTLWRVGAGCALALTSLWPDRPFGKDDALQDDFLQPPPGAPSLQSPMARALLQQADEADRDAATQRRHQRDVWAEWLTHSSAQNGNAATQSTSINGGSRDGGSSARPTHVSDDYAFSARPHTATVTPYGAPSAAAGLLPDAHRGTGGSGTAGRLTAPSRTLTRTQSAPGSPDVPGTDATAEQSHALVLARANSSISSGGVVSSSVTDGGLDHHRMSHGATSVTSVSLGGPSVTSDAGGYSHGGYSEGATGGNDLFGRHAHGSTGPEARWSDPLVSVDLLGYMWVPDLDGGGVPGAAMHLEFMLKTVCDEAHGPRLVQRRYKDFDELHRALAPVAKRAGVPLPPLPTSLTLYRNLTEEFAQQRQAALQQWLSMVVARPPLWCDPLRLFLGLGETTPSASTTPFRQSDGGACPIDDGRHGDTQSSAAPNPFGNGGSEGGRAAKNGGGQAEGAGSSGVVVGGGATYSAELRWIISRAQQPGCGVMTEGTGFFRASTLVKWLLLQSLATSREQV